MPSDWAFPIAVIMGFLIVAGTSWDKFSEPTFTEQDKKESKYYLRFGPKFIALRKKYGEARLVYVCIMCAIYLAVSLTPWLADFIPGLTGAAAEIGANGAAQPEKGLAGSPYYPLAVAAGLMGFQAVPYLKIVEAKCRRFLHAWAKIPKGAKETINKLWRSDFDFSDYEGLEELANREDEFETVSVEDFKARDNSIERDWARICCTLYSLRKSRKAHSAPGGFDADCYSDDFFEEFEPEYDEIRRLYRNLGKAVVDYRARDAKANGSRTFSETRRAIEEDIHSLLDQVFAFVSCAVRSKQTTESSVITTLNKLGYVVPEPVPVKVDTGAFILAALGLLIVFPLISFFGPALFDGFVSDNITVEDLRESFHYLPLDTIDGALWAASTIAIHIGAAWAALLYRARKVRAGEWRGKRPGPSLEKRAIATLIGGTAGLIILSLMTALYLLDNRQLIPGDQESNLNLLWHSLTQSLIWVPLPLTTAGFAVYHRDAPIQEPRFLTKLMWSLGQGALMALFAFFLCKIYTDYNSPAGKFEPPLLDDKRTEIEFYFQLLTATVVFLIGAYLGWLFPHRGRSRFKGAIIGDWDIASPIPGMDYVSLTAEGAAQRRSKDLHRQESGHWTVEAGKLRIEWERGDQHTVNYIAGEYDKLELVDESAPPEADHRKLLAARVTDPM